LAAALILPYLVPIALLPGIALNAGNVVIVLRAIRIIILHNMDVSAMSRNFLGRVALVLLILVWCWLYPSPGVLSLCITIRHA
jgi:hypothetical protein